MRLMGVALSQEVLARLQRRCLCCELQSGFFTSTIMAHEGISNQKPLRDKTDG